MEEVSVQKKSELRDRGEVFKTSINSTLNVLGIYFQAMLQTNSGVHVTVLSHLHKSSDSKRRHLLHDFEKSQLPPPSKFPWLRQTQGQLLCLQPKMRRNDIRKKPFGWEKNKEKEDIS